MLLHYEIPFQSVLLDSNNTPEWLQELPIVKIAIENSPTSAAGAAFPILEDTDGKLCFLLFKFTIINR